MRLLALLLAVLLSVNMLTANTKDTTSLQYIDVFSDPEKLPTFEGGDLNKFRQWVQNNIVYPPSLAWSVPEGRLVARFVIEKDGTLSSIEILQIPHKLLSEEVVRPLNASPKWEPAMTRGQPVRLVVSIPVDFERPPTKNDRKSGKGDFFPTFQGGDLNTFRLWVMDKLSYPEELIDSKVEGRFVCSFVIERDGSLTSIEVLESPHELMTQEVMRILKKAKKWNPAIRDGDPYGVSFTLPIDFRLH